jgi:hypothetical protein
MAMGSHILNLEKKPAYFQRSHRYVAHPARDTGKAGGRKEVDGLDDPLQLLEVEVLAVGHFPLLRC